VLDLLAAVIKKSIENSHLVEYGHPKGAIALAAAGVRDSVLPLFVAHSHARLSERFRCSIKVRKFVVAYFPAILMGLWLRTT
jgi:hypothetical protein